MLSTRGTQFSLTLYLFALLAIGASVTMDGPSHVAPVASAVGSGDLAVALGCWRWGAPWVLLGAGMLVLSNKQASATLSSDAHIFYKH